MFRFVSKAFIWLITFSSLYFTQSQNLFTIMHFWGVISSIK